MLHKATCFENYSNGPCSISGEEKNKLPIMRFGYFLKQFLLKKMR